MKINLEILQSCTIKRKKPWSKVSWLGKTKEQLFIMDHQRLSQIDAKTGKTKRRVGKLTSSHLKNFTTYNTSDNGAFLVGVDKSGDLFVWLKDANELRTIAGLNEFALKLGSHASSVFVSDDLRRILLVTSRNKVFVWESDGRANASGVLAGNWSNIVASKEVKSVEDSKELVLHARFSSSLINGICVTCCFVFNYDSRLTVNVLRIKWLSPNEITHPGECRFETIWLCYQPQLVKYTDSISFSLENGQHPVNFASLYTRGSFVIRLSHSSDLIALASNQKYVDQTSLVFMSTANGSLLSVNLRNFGLNEKARGRHYWIQDLRWLSDDLYLAGITKHGAIFLVSRLGQPLFIHAIGKEINMGPALYITFHPLIIVRGKSGMSFNKSDDTSLSSTIDINEGENSKANLNSQQQKYSLACHPVYPVLVCSDGFLMCVLRINSAYATQPRLIRELMNNSIGLLNSLSDKPVDVVVGNNIEGDKDDQIPEWGFQANQSSESSDSGVDSNEKIPKETASVVSNTNQRRSSLSASQSKIAEGKIIFSFLPQIIPISMETLNMHESVATRIELAFESMQSAWGLLVSMTTAQALLDTAECDRTAKSIQFMFSRLAKILLSLDFDHFKGLSAFKLGQLEAASEENEEADKLKICACLFIRLLKYIYFDPASPHNPNSHMLAYLRSFITRFLLTLLKSGGESSGFKRLELGFSILTYSESLLKCAYRLVNNGGSEIQLFLCNDSIRTLKSQVSDEAKIGTLGLIAGVATNSATDSQAIDTDSLEKEQKEKDALLVRQRRIEKVQFADMMFENCWLTLLHYAKKYNIKKGGRSLESNLLTILTQRKLASKFSSIPKLLSSKLNNINPGDMAYLDRGDLDYSIEIWSLDYENALNDLEKLTSQTKIPLSQKAQHFLRVSNLRELTTMLIHKIFYACLTNYRLDRLLDFIEGNLIRSTLKGGDTNKYSLFKSVFSEFNTSKPLPTLPESLVYVLRSLARFMADYLDASRSEIKICEVLGVIIEWPKINDKKPKEELKIRLEKERLVAEVNQKYVDGVPLAKFFCPDKVVELMLVTGLFEEAVYFLNSVINDWRSSFLLDSVLRESIRYEENIADDHRYEDPLIAQISTFLSYKKQTLMENSHSDSSAINSMRSLLTAAVMTKRDPLPDILAHLMRDLVNECAQLNLLVPADFYLPAPPIYCPQLFADSIVSDEVDRRIKIGKILKELMIVFESSRLYVPLIKWYLESLNEAANNMKENLGVRNEFKLNPSLRQLLTQLKHQKIGNIPEPVLLIFRDMCALVGFLEARDRFSYELRHYMKFFMDHQDISMIDSSSREVLSMSLSLIDFGSLLLSYGVKHGGSNKPEIWTIAEVIVSTISKLGKHGRFIPNIDLESRLARCVHKINRVDENFSDVVQAKLDRLVTEWRTIPSRIDPNVSMGDLFANHILPNESVVSVKVDSIFGPSEEILFDNEEYKRLQPNHLRVVGGYDFERDERSIKLVEMFIRVGFDRTENWSGLSSVVNVDYPLLSEFYEPLRDRELLGIDECKTYLIANGAANNGDYFQTRRKRRRRSPTRLIVEKVPRKGLFRWRSFEQLRSIEPHEFPARSSSLGASLNLSTSSYQLVRASNESGDEDAAMKPWKCLDYGPKYLPTLALSIWLMQWSNEAKCLGQQPNRLAALKMKHLTANELVGAVYLADGRDLWMESRRPLKPAAKLEKKIALTVHTDEDTITHVSSTESSSLTKELGESGKKETTIPVHVRTREESSSSTLDISSLTENHVNAYLTKKEQFDVDQFVQQANTLSVITQQQNNQQHSPPQSTPIAKIDGEEHTNILDLTEYFQLDELKTSATRPIIIAKPQQNEAAEQQETQESKKKSGTNRAVDFFTGIFRRNSSQSQSRSRSPEKPQQQLLTTTSALSKSSTSPVRSLSPTKNVRIEDNRPTSSISSFPAPIRSEQSSVQDMIRNELKRIVQIQHDTVMSLLNGGQPTPINQQLSYPFQQQPQFASSMNDQISALLKQQQTVRGQNGMEFIVETKIRTVDAAGNSRIEPENMATNRSSYKGQSQQPEPVNYFMKTFDQPQTSQQSASSRLIQPQQSKFVKIPLLNSRYLDSKPDVDTSITPVDSRYYNTRLPYLEQYQQQPSKQPMHSPPQQISSNPTQMHGVSLINFKSKSRGTEPQPLLDLDVSHRDTSTAGEQQNMNPHLRKFIDLSSPNRPTRIGEFKLLKLNYNQAQQEQQQHPIDRSIKPTPREEETAVKPEPPKSSRETKSVEVEVEKPMYDGYILKPDAVKDMLDDLPEQPFYSSAEAHYNATQHLREKPKGKKTESRSTMTEIKPPLQSTQTPTPPDVLLNLKFDTSSTSEAAQQRDFVNVVDLDSDSIDHILKLIENDQNNREKNRRKQSGKKDDNKTEEEPFEKGDELTKKLLEITRTEDEYKQYDEIMAQQIAAETERSKSSIQKRRALNDLQFIDDRIRAMNEIADEISGDYAKFGKLADKLSDLVDLRQMAEKATEIDVNVDVDNQRRRQSQHEIKPEVKKTEKEKQKKPLKQVEILLDDSELSDLRESEEAKLQEILGEKKKKKKDTSKERQKDKLNRSSVSEVLKDVLEDLDVQEASDLDDEVLDEILERSTSPRRRQSLLPPSESAIRRRSSDKHPLINTTFEKQPIKERKVSPTVKREKEMQMRREQMKEKFAERREREAKKLLKEMLSDEILPENERTSRKSTPVPYLELTKPSSSSRSPQHKASLMAKTIADLQRKEALKKSESDLLLRSLEARSQQSHNVSPPRRQTSKSPSPLRQTVSRSPDRSQQQQSPPQRLLKPFSSLVHLQDPSKLRQSTENEPLTYQDQLLSLQKSGSPTRQQHKSFASLVHLQEPNKLRQSTENDPLTYQDQLLSLQKSGSPTRQQHKSFTSLVHLQDPTKLRKSTENEPLTYQDQLHALQEQTVPPPDLNNAVEMKKVYGSKRVKIPGAKTSVRKGQVKTYSQRLKELKPDQSQARVLPRPNIPIQNQQPSTTTTTIQRKPIAQAGKHQLRTKELDKKPGAIPRYKPYSTTTIIKPVDGEDDDELSEWVLDDNLKRIIYDNGDSKPLAAPKQRPPTVIQRATKKPVTQQSIGGDRDLMELLEEERKNDEMVRRALHDLDEMERRGRRGAGDEYVNKVGIDDLEATRSLSGDSLSGYLDWDEIDNMINTLK